MIQFAHAREITLDGFTGDDSPNDTPPPADQIFGLADRVPGSNLQTQGHLVALDFDDASEEATADFKTWVKDVKSGRWFSLEPEDNAENGKVYRAVGVMAADLFIQITDVSAAESETLTVRCGESI